MTDEYETEAAATRQRQLLQGFEDSGLPLLAFDNAARVVYINRAARDLYGVDLTVLGQPGSSLFTYEWLDPDDDAASAAALQAGRSWSGQVQQVLPDGRTLRVEIHVSATYDAQGARSGTLGFVRDITALHKDERLMQLVVQHLQEVVTLHAPDGIILYTNRPSIRAAGDDLADLRGRSGYDIIHPDDRDVFRREVHARALHGEMGQAEWRRIEPGQPPAWMETRATPVAGRDGHVQYVLTLSREIGERRARDERLRVLESAVLHASDAVVISTAPEQPGEDAPVLYVNHGFTHLSGYQAHELSGQRQSLLIGPGSDPLAVQRIVAALAAGQQVNETYLAAARFGRPLWIDLALTPVVDDVGRLTHWIGVLRDVTRARQQLQLEHDRRAVLEMSAASRPLPEILEALVQLIERQLGDMTGSLHLLRGNRLYQGAPSRLPLPYLQGTEGLEIGPVAGSCGAAAFQQRSVVVGDIRSDRHWEAYRHLALPNGLLACWSTPILSQQRAVLGTFAVYASEPRWATPEDVALLEDTARLAAVILERHHALDEIQRQARHDHLTGLPNRSRFAEQLEAALTSCPPTQVVAVGLLDIDRFKVVNDSLGHAAGDELLQLIARRLQTVLEGRGSVARMGGDEFTLIFTPQRRRAEIAALAEAVLEAFAAPFLVAGHELFVRGSLGLAVFPEDTAQPGELLRLADIGMYQAKRRHQGWAFCDVVVDAPAARGVALEAALHRALERSELSLHYQPIVDAATGRPTGVEALLRWDSPDLGPVSTAELIPVAEESGLIASIGEWVLHQACQDAVRLQAVTPGLRMSVNLSARQFHHLNLRAALQHALETANCPAHLLTLELTEGILMDADAAGRLAVLHDLGVRLSIDDFGTGYSSLSYLKWLPVQELKIDRSFVTLLNDEPDGVDAQIIRALVGLAGALHLTLTAEGVETPAQAAHLRDLGVGALQGWLISRAKPFEELLTWLQDA
ncbi:EAL domain-containing protein [Deinococcus sp. KSM4-11]|uniref:EAL domain-containing protein n=1 Tax=Deinococcus sp. KSM4-11 TaxID=2568654 RepID=UPI0010A3756B|nr:EAL domain-containing protein [Deinococcus sp. KSM4-11]THF87241.1 EAL domain-containing protein [Deinococcus sp. KSM4-11]